MKFRQLAAILLSVVMLLTLFTSCEGFSFAEPKPKELLLLASANMLANPYEMNIGIDMSSSNEEVNAAVSLVNGDYTAKVDGKNVAMNMSVAGVSVDYLLVDDVIYMDMYGIKVKISVNNDQAGEIMGDIIGTFDGSVEGFGDLDNATMTKENGLTTITINGVGGMINEMIDDLDDDMGTEDVGLDISVNEEKTSIVVVIDAENNYKSMKVNMSLEYAYEGVEEKIGVDCVYYYTFDFSEDFTITAPENADEYITMDYDAVYGK